MKYYNRWQTGSVLYTVGIVSSAQCTTFHIMAGLIRAVSALRRAGVHHPASGFLRFFSTKQAKADHDIIDDYFDTQYLCWASDASLFKAAFKQQSRLVDPAFLRSITSGEQPYSHLLLTSSLDQEGTWMFVETAARAIFEITEPEETLWRTCTNGQDDQVIAQAIDLIKRKPHLKKSWGGVCYMIEEHQEVEKWLPEMLQECNPRVSEGGHAHVCVTRWACLCVYIIGGLHLVKGIAPWHLAAQHLGKQHATCNVLGKATCHHRSLREHACIGVVQAFKVCSWMR
jgi:hypothetical protein